MSYPLYPESKRLVGIDIWRGVAIILALTIHFTEKSPIKAMIAGGDFFSGYFSIGVVFVGIAGMMGMAHFGQKQTLPWSLVLGSQWGKTLKLLFTYALYALTLALLGLSGAHFLSIYITLGLVYILAPLVWAVNYFSRGKIGLGMLAGVFFVSSTALIKYANFPPWFGTYLYDHWHNTTPILPMMGVYCGGAWLYRGYQEKRISKTIIVFCWAAVIGYSFMRYGLNSRDIYLNNNFWVRFGLFLSMGTAALTIVRQNWPRFWRGLAFVGMQSFYIFTMGNFLISLLPNKPFLSRLPPIYSWLTLLMILSVTITSAVLADKYKRSRYNAQ